PFYGQWKKVWHKVDVQYPYAVAKSGFDGRIILRELDLSKLSRSEARTANEEGLEKETRAYLDMIRGSMQKNPWEIFDQPSNRGITDEIQQAFEWMERTLLGFYTEALEADAPFL